MVIKNFIRDEINKNFFKIYDFNIIRDYIFEKIENNEPCNLTNMKKDIEGFKESFLKDIVLVGIIEDLKSVLKAEKTTEMEITEVYEEMLLRRLNNAFRGLFCEGIFNRMLNKNSILFNIPLERSDDYEMNVDFLVSNMDGKMVYVQMKSSSYLDPFQVHQDTLDKERLRHQELGIKVKYIYCNYDFKDRYFYTNKKIPFHGYGNKDRVLEQMEQWLFED